MSLRRLKQSECAILHLGLKSHWYRMIESGKKRVEFREANPYWTTRLANWARRVQDGKTPVILFRNGYGRFSPRMAFVAGHGEGVIFSRFSITRITNWARVMPDVKTPVLMSRIGYGGFSPRMAFVAGRGEGVVFARFPADDPVQHKEIGEFQKARFAIFIGERVVLQYDRPPRENPARPLYQRGRLMICPRA